MSGTNVWLKLKRSKRYLPEPYLLDSKMNVWHLPYPFALNHTVEEITDMCQAAEQDEARLLRIQKRILDRLAPLSGEISQSWFLPEKRRLKEFLEGESLLFIALHGGMGENGELQKTCEKRGIFFNGSGCQASALCMDKYATSQALAGLESQGIYTVKKRLDTVARFDRFTVDGYKSLWADLTSDLGTSTIIAKPVDDR